MSPDPDTKMPLALTRLPAPTLETGQLTYLERQSIDYQLALRQHDAYCEALGSCGLQVIRLEALSALADSVFVEDCAIILDELTILTSPGTLTRRDEIRQIEPEIARLRPVSRISPPATIEGGDVLQMGKTPFAGISPRTNPQGVQALQDILQPYGYSVIPVQVYGCLHLKTGCTALDEHTLLVNPGWIDLNPLRDFTLVPVPENEPWAANVLRVGETLFMSAAFPKTLELVQSLGYSPKSLDISEYLKAEGGLTCLSLIFSLT